MPARIVTGNGLADQILRATRARVDDFVAGGGASPTLAVILAGENSAALAYLDRLDAFAQRAHIRVSRHELDSSPSLQDAVQLISRLNADAAVHGILPLLPLGDGIVSQSIAECLHPTKDVDGMHPLNIGRSELGLESHVACTALGAVALAEAQLHDLRGIVATVVGGTGTVGRPLSQLLLRRGATVTTAHVHTRDLATACRSAQILFVAVGRAGLIDALHIARGAMVVDIGINMVGTQLLGDVNLNSAREVAGCITAVPDGVGPVTSAYLMSNCADAARRSSSARV